jgi:predicted membrane protein
MRETDPILGSRADTRRNGTRGHYGRDVATRSIWALLLIVAGVLLFLYNIGLISIQVWSFWPLFPIALGLTKLLNSRSLSERVWSSCVIAFGVVFLLNSLGVLRIHSRDGSWPVALLLIAAGVVALVKTFEKNPPKAAYDLDGETVTLASSLNENVLFGGIIKRVDSSEFGGGVINCIFGNVEVDLRRAVMLAGRKSATVDVHCVFGAVKIRVPESWQVNVQGLGVFGTFEDKIIPVRSPDIFESPALIVVGHSVFGSVEVEN